MIKFNTFNSNSVPSAEEFEAAMPKRSSKVFTPGEYVLTVHTVEATGPSQDDPTWQQIKLQLVEDGRQMLYWLDVPTSTLTYKHPEGTKRNPFSKFLSLQQFVRALGGDLEPTPESVNSVLPGLFSDADTLIGQTVKVQIGYFGHYIAYNSDLKMYYIADKTGKPIDDDTYEDRDVAAMEAASAGIHIQKFPRILKFLAAEA